MLTDGDVHLRCSQLRLFCQGLSSRLLVVVIGSIGAGKTTLARNLDHRCGFVRVSADDVRLAVTGSPASLSPAVWAECQRRVGEALGNGSDVVLDATGAAPQFPALLRSLGEATIIRLECEWRTWQEREKRRHRDLHYPKWLSSTKASRKIRPRATIHTDSLTSEQVFTAACSLLEEVSHADVHLQRQRVRRFRQGPPFHVA